MAVQQPIWLRHGKTPHGTVMSKEQRRTLRVLCHFAEDDGWVYKSSEFIAYHAKIHRSTVPRQLRKFVEWGLVVPDGRLVLGKLRAGWLIQAHLLKPIPRERIVPIAEGHEMQKLRITVRALQRRVAELEEIRRQFMPIVTAAHVESIRQPAAADTGEVARRFAGGLGMARVHFVHCEGQKIFGEASQLMRAVDAGLAPELCSDLLWPTKAVPVVKLAEPLASLLQHETEEEITETLRWYRADVEVHPEQINWYRAKLFWSRQVWFEAVARANDAKQRNEELLMEVLRRCGRDRRVVLPFDGHTEMSVPSVSAETDEVDRMAILDAWRPGRAAGEA